MSWRRSSHIPCRGGPCACGWNGSPLSPLGYFVLRLAAFSSTPRAQVDVLPSATLSIRAFSALVRRIGRSLVLRSCKGFLGAPRRLAMP